jgi:ankyrin repeat protein
MNPQYGMSDLISKKNIDVNICSRSKMTPLMDAANRLDIAAAKKLLSMGADVNKVCDKGYAVVPLLASRDPSRNQKVLEMLKLMLDKGANVNASMYRSGMSGIMLAARRGYKDTVELLLKAGADLKGSNNISLVSAALGSRQYEMTAMLIKAGAPIDYDQSTFWVAVRRLAQEIEQDESSNKKSEHSSLFAKLFVGKPVVDLKKRYGRYIKRILDRMKVSRSSTVKNAIARVKVINEEYQYPAFKYRPPAGYYPAPYLQKPR